MRTRNLLGLIACAAFAVALLSPDLQAQANAFSAAAIQAWKSSVTVAGFMGAPRYTTALLPTCSTNNKGALAFDTTTGGMKVCDGSVWSAPGASAGGTNVWTGSNTFTDSLFFLVDDGDATKKAQFQASGISTGTTRTYTLPDVNGTIFTGGGTNLQTTGTLGINDVAAIRIGTISGQGGVISYRTEQTPDTPMLLTGTVSNAWVMAEQADQSFDFALPQQTDPSLDIRSHNQNQNEHRLLGYYGDAGKGAIKTLTESSATSAFQVSIAASTGTGGIVDFTVFAADASDQQTLTGVLQFSGVNKAGTETCPTPTLTGTALNAVSTGTLTCSYAADTTPSNACNIQFNCVSSLTQTTLEVYYRVNLVGPGQVTPQ